MLISGYISNNFPKISKTDLDNAEQNLKEAINLTICLNILDQLNETNGEEARIEVRDDLEYNPEYYECTQFICEQFKKEGYDVKEEFDYDHPVFLITKKKIKNI
jgi:Tfp pilus assembly protein PilF